LDGATGTGEREIAGEGDIGIRGGATAGAEAGLVMS